MTKYISVETVGVVHYVPEGEAKVEIAFPGKVIRLPEETVDRLLARTPAPVKLVSGAKAEKETVVVSRAAPAPRVQAARGGSKATKTEKVEKVEDKKSEGSKSDDDSDTDELV